MNEIREENEHWINMGRSCYYSFHKVLWSSVLSKKLKVNTNIQPLEQRVIGISGSLIWSKTLMELIFIPCGEFRWSPEGPVSQIHSPHLHVGAPGIFSDLLRSVQMLKREEVRKATGRYRTCSTPVKLQPWFLSLQWKICPWAETLMMMMIMMYYIVV